ncbi:hypothetical protein ABZ370_27065 [Streptomyces sp. NPDC005962]|uniref:hypothetical protein n=1 Tax=Streptomyces sp. NPDC005962 TaxID=3154466 RepID=UPI0033EAFC92
MRDRVAVAYGSQRARVAQNAGVLACGGRVTPVRRASSLVVQPPSTARGTAARPRPSGEPRVCREADGAPCGGHRPGPRRTG